MPLRSAAAPNPSETTAPAPARRAWPAWITAFLGSARAPWIILGVALLLHLPGIATGWSLDDHNERVRIRAALTGTPSPLEAYPATLWDIFTFIPRDPALKHELMDEGGLTWTTDPTMEVGFFRPVSALTHLADNLLWTDSAVLAHVQNLVWLALLLLAVHVLYRRVQGPAWVAGLAFLLYALDDARAPAASWIASRNGLIATLLGVLALVAHHRARRDGWRAGHLVGPLAFAVGLLAGEAALATLGYLAAHALILDHGSVRARLGALAPFAAVTVVWFVVYASLGYGVRHSGVYADPAGDPLGALTTVATNLPLLLAAQLSGVWSDFSIMLTDGELTTAVICCVVYLFLFVAASSRINQSAEARYWALGAFLAALPAACGVPSDRMLTFVGIGAMGLVACFLDAPIAPGEGRVMRGALRVWTVALVLINVVAAPLLIPIRAVGNGTMAAFIERGEGSLPRVTTDQQVIAVNAPSEGMLYYAPMMRASRGEPGPGRLRGLASGRYALTVTRESADTLLVHPAVPYLDVQIERLVRASPFSVGDRVALTGVVIEVTAVTPDARPAETRWRFDCPLEDPHLTFLRWSDERIGFVPFELPAIGQRTTLPPVDLQRAFLGN